MVIKYSRAQRRHDYARLKGKRQYYWGYGHKTQWMGRLPADGGDINYMSSKLAGMVVASPAPCSCYMCGNPRRNSWADNPLTMQERKACSAAIDSFEEYEDQNTYSWEEYDSFFADWYGENPADDWYLRWMYIKG